jgi:dihydrofolate reductase
MATTRSKLRVHNLSVSLDGFAAGPDQTLEQPLGARGEELHDWAMATPVYRRMFGRPVPDDADETTDADDRFAAAGDVNVGATIMGRNMFGPVRGSWGDSDWTGWWGTDPPYHHPVFVLTHHAHDPIPMEGGTTFHFVTDGIESALEQAVAAAGGADVRIGGGAATVRQYMEAGLVDELHVAFSPILLGRGERLLDVGDAVALYEVAEVVQGRGAVHARIVRRP